MKIACIMMQRNERALLGPWLTYHADLFGVENLYVFDNGSDDEETIATLNHFERLGLNIEWGSADSNYFNFKGNIVAHCIKGLDRNNKYDFYFPLDCDEFLVAYDEIIGEFSVEKQSILRALEPYRFCEDVLSISFSLTNSTKLRDFYGNDTMQKKVFFAGGTCLSVDTGFHNGIAKKSNQTVKTHIGNLHFHYRGFWEQKYRSLLKLSGRISDFKKSTLFKHKQEHGPGFHLVHHVFMSEREYEADDLGRREIRFPAFIEKLDRLGTSIRNDDDDYLPMVAQLLDQEDRASFPFQSLAKGQSLSPSGSGIGREKGDKMKGHLDFVDVKGADISVTGWAADRGLRPESQIIIMADAKVIPVRSFQPIDRPDVTGVYPEIGRDCGFTLLFSMDSIPEDTQEIRVVCYDPRARASLVLGGAWGKFLNWPELRGSSRLA